MQNIQIFLFDAAEYTQPYALDHIERSPMKRFVDIYDFAFVKVHIGDISEQANKL